MEKRKWPSQQKLQIVLEGLNGQVEISKLCVKYQIAQGLLAELLIKHKVSRKR